MAVILCLVGINVTTRYNCQVRVFHVCFILAHVLIGHDPKVEVIFQFVRSSSDAPGLYSSCLILFLVLWVFSDYRCFSLDCVPHVRRSIPLFGSRTTDHLPKLINTHAASLAIWNGNKVVIALAAGTWGINVIFLIQGKPRPRKFTNII